MDIQAWRQRIDEIDEQLVALLNERAQCAIGIGDLKRQMNLPIFDARRERDVLDRVSRLCGGPLTREAIRRLFERIIDESRSVERAHGERRAEHSEDGAVVWEPPVAE